MSFDAYLRIAQHLLELYHLDLEYPSCYWLQQVAFRAVIHASASLFIVWLNCLNEMVKSGYTFYAR